MGALKSSHEAILGSLKETFTHFRNSSGHARPSLPRNLRRQAMDALEQGIPQVAVARACGVCVATLHNWRRGARPAPRRLEVVPEAPVSPQSAELTMSFPSGISVSGTPSAILDLAAKLGGLRL